MKLWKKILIIILIILAVGIIALKLFSSYTMNLIKDMSFEDMLKFTTSGTENAAISVGTIKNGIVEYKIYGKDGKELPDEFYIYEIGSISKTFTGTLLAKAMLEEKASLDDTIDSYMELPSDKKYQTLKRLVTHTSGYKNYYTNTQFIKNFVSGEDNILHNTSKSDLLKEIYKNAPEVKTHEFEYSNLGISIIGLVLENVYGGEYYDLMNEFLTDDLDLQDTFVSVGNNTDIGYWDWGIDDGYLPAGAILSTMPDMLKYLSMNMKEELPYIKATHEPLEKVNATTEDYEKAGIRIDSVGLTWMLDDENGIIWHNGGTDNFNSYIGFNKEKQTGVVILSNLAPNYKIPTTVMGIQLLEEISQ